MWRSHCIGWVVLFAFLSPLAAQEEAGIWCLEERAGTATTDQVGTFPDAAFEGLDEGAWVPAQVEGEDGIAGLRFDGEEGFLLLDAEESFDFTSDFTWAAWIRSEEEEAGVVFAKSPVEFWEPGSIALFVIEGFPVIDVGYVGAAEAPDRFVSDGLYHHLALTAEMNVEADDEGRMTLDRLTIYVDGEASAEFLADAQFAEGEEVAPEGGFRAGLGSFEEPIAPAFNGVMADLRLWGTALSPDDVFDVYTTPGSACEPEPLDCSTSGDTHCVSQTVTGPPGDEAGVWTVEVEAVDDSGDEIITTVVAEQMVGGTRIVSETVRGESSVDLRLRPGTWLISSTVDDDTFCDEEAADAVCFTEDVVVLPIEGELEALWCFEEREGFEVGDAIGENSGGLENVEEPRGSWVPGRVGVSAMRFDGEDDFILLCEEDDCLDRRVNLSESFTLSAWIRTSNPSAGTIFSHSDMYWEPGNQALFIREGLLVYDIGFVGELESFTDVADGSWHHVAITVERDFDGEFERAQLYIDGEPDALAEFLDFQAEGEDTPFGSQKIGWGSMDFPEEGSFFQGELDQIAFFSYALTEGEVISLSDEPGEGPDAGCPAVEPPDCEGVDPAGCPVALEAEGPGGTATAGPWLLTLLPEDEAEIPGLSFTLSGTNGEEDFSRTQFGNAEFEVELSEGTWTFEGFLDNDLFCPDGDILCAGLPELEVAPRPETLWAAWCFEEEGGELAIDSVDGLEAELVAFPEDFGDGEGPQWIEGLQGNSALLFDGEDDAVLAPESFKFDVTQDYSWSAWVQVGPDPTADIPDRFAGTILTIGHDLEGGWDDIQNRAAHNFFIHEGQLRHSVGFCCDESTFLEGVGLADGEPHHVAVVVDNQFLEDQDQARIYVDGVLALEYQNEFQVASGTPQQNALRLGFGAVDWPSNDFGAENGRDLNHFNGVIDAFKWYSYALSDEEILEDMDNPDASCTVEMEGTPFVRGDADASGQVNITDAIFVLNFLFLGGPPPSCLAAADADDASGLNITDGIYLLNYLFLGGIEPPPPFGACGVSPGLVPADCLSFAPCL